MIDISKIDENFKVNTNFSTENLDLYDCLAKPFEVCGLISPSESEPFFKRMPTEIAKKVNPGVEVNNRSTAGGRLRFRTDSKSVAIFAKIAGGSLYNMPITGVAGFDLYADGKFVSTFVPPPRYTEAYPALRTVPYDGIRDIEINFPLYSGVFSLTVGLDKGSVVEAPTPYLIDKPVVFYGSSITQGGCASHPGNAYTSIVSRELKCDHVNLGFSGSAKGETAMAEYIAGLDMSAFVYDYDYNSPSWKTLEATHEPMFKIIRGKNPDLPIIMISRPVYYESNDSVNRLRVITKTYQNAIAAGDKNVHLIDGTKMMQEGGYDGFTVESIHPNDFGFVIMAKKISGVLKEILKL